MKAVVRPFMRAPAPDAPTPDAPAPPGPWRPGVLEAMATEAGLITRTAFDFDFALDYPDEQTLGRLMVAPAGIATLVGPVTRSPSERGSWRRSRPVAQQRARTACTTSFTTSSRRVVEATVMELIAAILLAGPLGFFGRTQRQGLTLYLLAWALILPVQTISVHQEGHLDWTYPLVNAAILAAGLWLNRTGSRMGQQRRRRRLATSESRT